MVKGAGFEEHYAFVPEINNDPFAFIWQVNPNSFKVLFFWQLPGNDYQFDTLLQVHHPGTTGAQFLLIYINTFYFLFGWHDTV